MLKLNQVKLPIDHSEAELKSNIIKKLRIPGDQLLGYEILRRSIDARQSGKGGHPGKIYYQYAIAVKLKNERAFLKKNKNQDIILYAPAVYEPPKSYDPLKFCKPDNGCESSETFEPSAAYEPAAVYEPPVIVGSGPAGLFCGYILARVGYRPIIIERGSSVRERLKKVESFWAGGKLDKECNVQFGEGGAGTFSDGKLNTLVGDPSGLHRKVLEIFVEAGACEDILYDSKPHIGTDALVGIVENIRNDIIAHGGQVIFDRAVTGLILEDGQKAKAISGVVLSDGMKIKSHHVVLAIGHSARDTFKLLYEAGVIMEQKPFAIGVRIEHPQEMIDESQYSGLRKRSDSGKHDIGDKETYALPPASYKLTYRSSLGRSVYTFCMCPGGYVVNASSEEGMLAVNGMSYSRRDSANANSAVIVNVTPEDFMSKHPLAGVEFQRRWEKKAYEAGRGFMPMQRYDDFCAGIVSSELGEVMPCNKGAYSFADINTCLPTYVCESIKEGVKAFGRKIKGYDRGDALLTGVETRTSSPVRIVRDDSLQSNIAGLYPCGEGAGYAGGITSAAMDGLRVASAVARDIAG